MPTDKDLFERNALRIWKVGAYTENFEKPIIYTSGKIGPVYINCAEIQNHPEEWRGAIEDLIRKMSDTLPPGYISKTERIAGGEVRDLVFSIPVARKLGKKHTIIRKGETTHGLGGNLITKIREGERVILVSDLLTTGKSGKQWIGAIKDAGGEIEYYFNFFDRLQGGEENIKAFVRGRYGGEIVLVSLVQMNEDFFRIGIGNRFTTSEKYGELQRYLEDPDGWAINYLLNHPEFLVENAREGEKILNAYPVLKEDREFMKKIRSPSF